MKRELRQYEYTCDGYTGGDRYTPAGQPCPGRDIIAAYDADAADAAIVELRDWTERGWGWVWTARGWLCQRRHRDDPRDRDTARP
ncbi:hypothetical protein FZI85_25075 [Mycobacterium sp. CBMA293]|uniref:hypothetical protein n=1 Tax=unclassified Mycolicibacterium TaxID=2636767 RepID=UPI0012DFDE65|nr:MULTISPECIES: hypothetical protein [unclassified Mycolicibacterium]MUL47590.1 hypothetical protein [Mycolicibacterium sp. CBMA 360]MUL61892.1 hypothetical protein [Mycolicibacterium sp. CBMA 335]MUL68965.1 hypothetical protein [Mycolicibacterium sp. CBMA 311]MUL92818.1 hypothetical protein [Mycolicibacterium sp. CBMA 230]MUM08740.1 hypothetical protein [Mycolicibacterium sp. CBMA 213]